MDTITPPPVVRGDACASCAAPLAPDQRYCLNCGARSAHARVAFREILGRSASARPTPTTPVAPGAGDARAQRSLTVVASIGCLLLALGVGVLIGHGGRADTRSPAAGPAQVIKLQGGAAAGTSPTNSSATPAAKRKAKHRARAGSAATAGASKATNPTIKKLDKLSPEQYQKQSQKLPKTVGLGGKPPPKDHKKPAGGGSFQSIG